MFRKIATVTQPIGAGATNRLELGNFNGESVKELLLRFWLVHAEQPTSRDFKVYPNGVKGVATSAQVNQTGTATGNKTRDSLCFLAPSGRERISGYIRLQTELSPGGITVFDRRYEGFATQGDDPLTESTTGFYRSNGWWDRSDGALTSLDIVATSNDGDTLQPAIGEGSIFEVWRLIE